MFVGGINSLPFKEVAQNSKWREYFIEDSGIC